MEDPFEEYVGARVLQEAERVPVLVGVGPDVTLANLDRLKLHAGIGSRQQRSRRSIEALARAIEETLALPEGAKPVGTKVQINVSSNWLKSFLRAADHLGFTTFPHPTFPVSQESK